MNYFQTLKLDIKFNIDKSLLEKNYLNLQLFNHPDRSPNELDKQKRLLFCMELNNAYKILKDDLLRAEYLLKIQNVNLNEQNKPSILLLEKVWQEQDYLENLYGRANLEQFLEEKNQEKHNYLINLSKVFEENNLNSAIDIIMSLKYLTKLLDNIKLKINNATN